MKGGTWEGFMPVKPPVNVYSVRVEGPAGGTDWLQVRGRDEAAAREEVRRILMPGVRVTAVEFAGTSERW